MTRTRTSRTKVRAEERRWRRSDALALAAAITLGALLAWGLISIQQFTRELHNANEARDQLARQVQQLGEKPVAGPPGSRGDPDKTKPGATGPRGPSGEKGKPGDNGHTGADGKPGTAGSKGQDGSDGKPGNPGRNGADGQPGDAGPAGDSGPPGSDGVNGADGRNGEDGADGADGAQGPAGDPGPTGPQGEQGPAGERGPEGPPPSSWTFEYGGVTYTCTPSSEGSSHYSCQGDQPESPVEPRPEAAGLDPNRRQYP